MSATAEFRKLIDDLETRLAADGAAESRLKMFEDLLKSINVGLQDTLAVLEKDDDKEFLEAIRNLRIIAPDVIVNVPQVQPPAVNVNVQPAQVVVMPSEKSPKKGWKFSITQRDGNGAIRSISMQPE